jgi:hypothetical protein
MRAGYNFAVSSPATLRQDIKPSQQARILDRDQTDQIEVDGSTRMPNLVKASSPSSAETTSSP